MKGIVYDTATKKVLYKFDTSTYPALKANEAIKDRADINNIEAGADYNLAGDAYTNPTPVVSVDWKALYAAAATDSDRLKVIAQMLGLDK